MMKRKGLILLLLLLSFVVKVNAQAIHITGTVSKLMKEMTGNSSAKMPLSLIIEMKRVDKHSCTTRRIVLLEVLLK